MTYSASLPTLSSHEILDDAEEPLSDRQAFSSATMCRPIKAHAFTVSTGNAGPKPNQLTEDPRLFLQKEEKELATRPVPPWDIPLRRRRVVAHCPMHPEKAARPLPTKVCVTNLGPDLNPPGRRSLQPRCHKNLEPTLILNTEIRRTLGLCPTQQLDL